MTSSHALAAAVGLALLASGCSRQSETETGEQASPAERIKGPIRVGSKLDTEGELLATMIQQTLEANGFTVEDRSQTGDAELVRAALLSGEIDLYPEHTGSGLFFFQGDSAATRETFRDGEKGYDTVKRLDAANGVVWLAPAKANNSWVIVTRRDFAFENGLATLSDLATWVKSGEEVMLAGSQEFFDDAEAWPTFADAYGIALKERQRRVFPGGSTAQTEKAVAFGTDGVNFGMAYATDGLVADLGLVVLTDDRNAQLVYWPAPVLRRETLDAYPEIEAALAPVFGSLSLEKLQELNARVLVGREAPEDVARDYLLENGLIE